MTAEIALLNKLAVTLAADSAVTLSVGGSQKVYNSADKIFEGTVHDPIGVMVYNNPEFQGIPVESIIKVYRDNVCTGHYPTVFEFAGAFLKHLETIAAPQVTIADNLYGSLLPRMFGLREVHGTTLSEVFSQLADLPEQERTAEGIAAWVEQSYVGKLDDETARLTEQPEQAWATGLDVPQVEAAHGDTIEQIIAGVFDGIQLSEPTKLKLKKIGALCLLKDFQFDQLTGFVIAGYGKDEKFPSLISFEVFGVIAGRLKYRQTNKFDVDRSLVPVATVIPFAQQEMVDRFIYGMDAQFLDLCDRFFDGSLNRFKEQLYLVAEDLDDATSAALKAAADGAANAIMDEFRQTLVPNHLSTSKAQLSDIIQSMPKQELASLSESLVQITSLKRKFSAEAESVGGPIDVAMITRAEGFVWVKRKHFFDASLNPRYFHRRYGGVKALGNEGSEHVG